MKIAATVLMTESSGISRNQHQQQKYIAINLMS